VSKIVISDRRGAIMTLAVGVAVAVAACGSSSPGGISPDSPPQPSQLPSTSFLSSASPDVDKAKQEAITAYRSMWQDFVSAGTTSDWQSPKLGRYATGVALTNLTQALYADHSKGLITNGEPILSPTVSSTEPAGDPRKVIVTDCGDSTHWLKYRADSGQLADDTPGGKQLINAIVDRQADGSWKVSDFGVHDVGTC
jgi:hypothetical protein